MTFARRRILVHALSAPAIVTSVGLKIRSGHHHMDELLRAVGAIRPSVRTNVLYASMQNGTLDAAVTSSTRSKRILGIIAKENPGFVLCRDMLVIPPTEQRLQTIPRRSL